MKRRATAALAGVASAFGAASALAATALYQDLTVGTSAMHDTQEKMDRLPGMTVTGVKSGGDAAR